MLYTSNVIRLMLFNAPIRLVYSLDVQHMLYFSQLTDVCQVINIAPYPNACYLYGSLLLDEYALPSIDDKQQLEDITCTEYGIIFYLHTLLHIFVYIYFEYKYTNCSYVILMFYRIVSVICFYCLGHNKSFFDDTQSCFRSNVAAIKSLANSLVCLKFTKFSSLYLLAVLNREILEYEIRIIKQVALQIS